MAPSGNKVITVLTAATLVLAAACSGRSDPRTPEQAAARGDELLRKMSDTLKNAQTFSFNVAESHECSSGLRADPRDRADPENGAEDGRRQGHGQAREVMAPS